MPAPPLILALETSCDESAVAMCDGTGRILAAAISSQIPDHQPYGGVVPELAARNHLIRIRPLILQVLTEAEVTLSQIDAFAATAGPGLASSLLIGNTIAKSLALSCSKPYLAINHLEGHLLSPFLGKPEGIQPGVALIVSGGHTLLLHLRGPGDYPLLGRTRDDAAGEAFDKVARMLGLPYPGGPEIDRFSRTGNPAAFDFPRSMKDSGDFAFSFSGLKTSMFYLLPTLGDTVAARLPDLCASFQEDGAEAGVAADAAADADVLGVDFFGGGEGFGDEDIDDGFLKGGAEVGEMVGGVFPESGEQIKHGGFEAAEAEGEIAAVLHAAGEIEGGGVAGAGEFVDLRTAGVGQAQHAGDLVEGFAGGVIAGAAQ